MGNMWRVPLSELVRGYRAASHPLCGPLVRGGPAELAPPDGRYVDECHCCYSGRKAILAKFPEYLGPAAVYGV